MEYRILLTTLAPDGEVDVVADALLNEAEFREMVAFVQHTHQLDLSGRAHDPPPPEFGS